MTFPVPFAVTKFISKRSSGQVQWLSTAAGLTLLELVQVLGTQNVFVSIVKSGSLDNTKDFLHYLDYKLGELHVERSVMMSNWSHADKLNRTNKAGVFHFPEYAGHNENDGSRREWEVRRIPFLAKERNRGLEPLVEMGNQGKRFDKILVLNDVIYEPRDVLSLLGTREGRYSATCAMGFHYANEGYYDTFVLRDIEGQESIQRFTSLAHKWRAIILIDEADVYLAERSLQDVQRNGLVSVFLRHLEYFRGIMFLTTNRLTTFDDAFQRIHFAMKFGNLTIKAKKAIWETFLQKVPTKVKISKEEMGDLSRKDINGRQVRLSEGITVIPQLTNITD
jgi:hypothetical protein